MHPALGWQLANAKLEEARSTDQRGSALRALSSDRRALGVIASRRRGRWAGPMLAMRATRRARQRSLPANASRPTRG